MHDLACPMRAQGASVHGCERPRFFNPIWPTSFDALSPVARHACPVRGIPRCKVGKSETNWDDFRGLERDINVRCSEARADFSRAYNASPARNRVGLHMRLSHLAIRTRRPSMAAEQRSDRWRREQVGLRYRSKVWFHRAGPGMGDRPAQIDSASPPYVPYVPYISRVMSPGWPAALEWLVTFS